MSFNFLVYFINKMVYSIQLKLNIRLYGYLITTSMSSALKQFQFIRENSVIRI